MSELKEKAKFGESLTFALDKTTDFFFTSAINKLNNFVQETAETPEYFRVVNSEYLRRVFKKYKQDERQLQDFSNLELVRLRAVFCNAWFSLEEGQKINRYLFENLQQRFEEIYRLIHEAYHQSAPEPAPSEEQSEQEPEEESEGQGGFAQMLGKSGEFLKKRTKELGQQIKEKANMDSVKKLIEQSGVSYQNLKGEFQRRRAFSDTQVIRVIKKLRQEGISPDKASKEQVIDVARKLVSVDQDYYDKVYEGLLLEMNKSHDKAFKVLREVQDRPHFLVHWTLAKEYLKQGSSVESQSSLHQCRQCQPGNVFLYEDKLAGKNPLRAQVLKECVQVLEKK